MNRALRVLHDLAPEIFPSIQKDDYRIVNAVADIHFLAATGRTEAIASEIRAKGNLERLKRCLADKQHIVALGRKAVEAADAAGLPIAAHGSHPSMQNINSKFRATAAAADERMDQRIRAYATEIVESITQK